MVALSERVLAHFSPSTPWRCDADGEDAKPLSPLDLCSLMFEQEIKALKPQPKKVKAKGKGKGKGAAPPNMSSKKRRYNEDDIAADGDWQVRECAHARS